MKAYISISLAIAILTSVFFVQPSMGKDGSILSKLTGSDKSKNETVYIIPIQGVIERGLLYVIRRSLAQAEREGAATIVFHMDTPGGLVGVTEEIVRMLIDLPDEVKTYTFVDKDALSAGALISVATDEIYMAPGSRLGASAIVSLFGDLPDGDTKEKHVSSTLALIKSAAQRRGHDEKLVEAFIRRDYEYKIGKDIICEKGKLLTLTDIEAVRIVGKGKNKHPLLASGTAKDLDQFLKKIKKSKARTITISATWSEKIARWIELLGIVFLAGGLLGIYIEFKTPGFGIPGLAGIVLLAIFFWGHHIAGLAGVSEAALFLLGVILVGIEIFVIPGFGITGVTGIFCIVASLGMALVQHFPGNSFYDIDLTQLEGAVTTLVSGITLSFILMMLIVRFLPQTQLFRHIALFTSMTAEEGYMASKDTEELIGMKGMAATALHPSGIGEFGNERMNIVARGDFIDKGMEIIIEEAHGNRIVVEAVDSDKEG